MGAIPCGCNTIGTIHKLYKECSKVINGDYNCFLKVKRVLIIWRTIDKSTIWLLKYLKNNDFIVWQKKFRILGALILFPPTVIMPCFILYKNSLNFTYICFKFKRRRIKFIIIILNFLLSLRLNSDNNHEGLPQR